MERKKQEIVLSYGDSLLYTSDYELLLNDTCWLNDNIIGFYFEYLNATAAESFRDEVLFIG